MKERPILMCGEMVRAVLEGRKTQTRRIVKDVRPYVEDCPYGREKDQLWVKETFAPMPGASLSPGNGIIYRATETSTDKWLWKPSIFMPKWASRIILEVQSVRIERVQNIERSPLDIIAEGYDPIGQHKHLGDIQWYRNLWDSLNGKTYPWSSNPWVWRIAFRVL